MASAPVQALALFGAAGNGRREFIGENVDEY
jgi:hypothetical protein